MIHRNNFIFRTFCITFWAVTCSPFIIEEWLTPLAGFRSMLLLLFDAAILVLGLMTLRDRRQIILVATFFLLAFTSTILLNDIGWMNLFNGSRLFFGMLFAPSIFIFLLNCRDKDRYRASLDRQMYIFLWIQAFCVTWQFIKYGANDHGGGSMGNGCSGIISTLIILISYYFTTRDFDPSDFKKSLWRNRKYILLIYPVALNETKVSMVFLLIYALLLFHFQGKSMVKLICSLPVICILGLGFQFAYDAALGGKGYDMGDSAEMGEYLFGKDVEYEIGNIQDLIDNDMMGAEIDGEIAVQDLPRFIKIGLVPAAVGTSRGGTLFGAGLGHFKGGTLVKKTDFYNQYEWLITGTVNIYMFLYMQLGLLGFVWFAFYLYFLLDFRKRSLPYAMQLKLFLLTVAIVSVFYNDSFMQLGFCIVFAFLGIASTFSTPRDKDDIVPDSHTAETADQ